MGSRLGVRVGNHHLYEEDPEQVDIAVSAVIVHEDYDSWTTSNDICILDLAASADLSSDVISTIALPMAGEEYDAGTDCTVTGWGTTTEEAALAESSRRLLFQLSVMMTAVSLMDRVIALT